MQHRSSVLCQTISKFLHYKVMSKTQVHVDYDHYRESMFRMTYDRPCYGVYISDIISKFLHVLQNYKPDTNY